jgi:S-DNA-T family DNA segregation ATPase FtsK/SpoIIIE
LKNIASALERALDEFGHRVRVIDTKQGPLVSVYEIEIAAGTRASQIIKLSEDVARLLGVASVQINVMPGSPTLAVEIPNEQRETILLNSVLASEEFKTTTAALPLALGLDVMGEVVITDLATMPHVLVSGTTGSGKSVGINAMIISLMTALSADDCKFLMIDPKMLELSIYNGIPHLVQPVITDPRESIRALEDMVEEMERRYRLLADARVRNIKAYREAGNDLPYIVVFIDEFADLMQTGGKTLEGLVQRLAQKARAAGIHVVMATQRPSVDVVTGVIKSNFPARICFRVSSEIDSRTALGQGGAQNLLGWGDMLISNGSTVRRVHGAFVSDDEVDTIVENAVTKVAEKIVDDFIIICEDLITGEIFELV